MQKNGQNDPKDRKASLKASLFLKSFLGGFAINNADELADREDSRKHGTSRAEKYEGGTITHY